MDFISWYDDSKSVSQSVRSSTIRNINTAIHFSHRYYLSFCCRYESSGGALFDVAECPDFFPLPSFCTDSPSCSITKPGTVLPNYVHKQSSSGQDFYTLGVYEDGPRGTHHHSLYFPYSLTFTLSSFTNSPITRVTTGCAHCR